MVASQRLRPLNVIVVTAIAFLLICSASRAGEKTLISIDDLYSFDAPTDLAVSPDGKSAVYARRWTERSSRTVRFALWRVEGNSENSRPMEDGQPDARQPIFSPDGKWIVFTSTRSFPDGSPAVQPVPTYSDPATDIWLIPATGGKAIPLAGPGKSYGRVLTDPFYGNIAFSPDGRRLVFVADDGRDPRTPQEIENDVRIVRDDQGEGYEGYGPAQIWIAELSETPRDVAAERIMRITNDDVWYGDPQWSPDGRSIVVHANRTSDRESARYSINKNFDLWRIHVGHVSNVPIQGNGKLETRRTYELEQLTSGPGPEVSPRFSPDGQTLLCMSIPRKGTHFDAFNLILVDLASSGPRSRVLFDHHGPESDKPPHLPPSFPLPRDCWLSSGKFYYSASDRTETRQQAIDVSQSVDALADSNPSAHSDQHARLSEARRKLSPPANRFLQDRIVAQEEVVRWKSDDGLGIEGVVTWPTKPGATRPFPLVLYPHGGPHSRSTRGFNMNAQVFAAHGYVVFQPNFRGSAGYGQKFIDADRFDFGGRDMRDILTGIDYLIRQGIVDARRQFVYGVSYGGFTTCSLIGQTNQFRAAVPQNAVTDLTAMWCLSDLQSWTEWEFGGRPWEVPQAMREHSPLTRAAHIRTPTLILHATHDRRCPLPMGTMFYRALKSSGVETQMVLYPDEGHPIKQLPHQEDILRRVLAWFASHD
jgi:dipeptidyl aminopeptidase/acylaminoacyl peptidase